MYCLPQRDSKWFNNDSQQIGGEGWETDYALTRVLTVDLKFNTYFSFLICDVIHCTDYISLCTFCGVKQKTGSQLKAVWFGLVELSQITP